MTATRTPCTTDEWADALCVALDAAGEGWRRVLPADAYILSAGHNTMRDAVQLRGQDDTVLYRGCQPPYGDGRWHVQGWSQASARRRTRTTPLHAQRAGAPAPAIHDGDVNSDGTSL